MILVWLSPEGELLTMNDTNVESRLGSDGATALLETVVAALLAAGFECLGEL